MEYTRCDRLKLFRPVGRSDSFRVQSIHIRFYDSLYYIRQIALRREQVSENVSTSQQSPRKRSGDENEIKIGMIKMSKAILGCVL